jgi:hypothetical protein
VNNVPCGQAIAFRDFGITRLTTTEQSAFVNEFRPCGTMNGSIDTSATEQ